MALTIAVLSQKGGTGKTTTVRTLTDVFSRVGLDVVAIDADPQGNLSDYFDTDPNAHPTLGEVLAGQAKAVDAVHGQVIPANLGLAESELILAGKMGRELTLRNALRELKRQHDVIIIDCPPTLGLLTINALVASNRVIIPVQTQYYAIKGLTALIKVINTIKLKLNHDLEILGLLATFYDGRTVLAREMLANLRELGDHRVFNTMIKQTVKLGEAPLTGKPVTEYATGSAAARAFRDLAQEVIELG